MQLRAEFGFDEAAAVAEYLRDLGCSHVYLSPVLQAMPGSAHGYDVVDPQKVSADLGGPEAHARLCRRLGENALGQLLDIVPNHMAIGASNPWWWDVLENGPASLFAHFFDVEWAPPEERLRNKVLLPVLGDHAGRLIDAGEIRVIRDGGSFTVRYHEHTVPVAPRSLAVPLARAARRCGSADLAFVADALADLPLPTDLAEASLRRRHRDKEVLRGQLGRLLAENPSVAAAVDEEITALNLDPDALDAFLGQQNCRLAYWRTAARDLGYRRFFDINSLVAAGGGRAGVPGYPRPARALDGRGSDRWRSRRSHRRAGRSRRLSATVAPDRTPGLGSLWRRSWNAARCLPGTWPVDGNTGYDFLNEVLGLFVFAPAEGALSRLYTEFTGQSVGFDALARASKRLILGDLLGQRPQPFDGPVPGGVRGQPALPGLLSARGARGAYGKRWPASPSTGPT